MRRSPVRRTRIGLCVLLAAFTVAGIAAIAQSVRWAHSSGALIDDTNAGVDAFLAVASGCLGIALLLAGAFVSWALGTLHGR